MRGGSRTYRTHATPVGRLSPQIRAVYSTHSGALKGHAVSSLRKLSSGGHQLRITMKGVYHWRLDPTQDWSIKVGRETLLIGEKDLTLHLALGSVPRGITTPSTPATPMDSENFSVQLQVSSRPSDNCWRAAHYFLLSCYVPTFIPLLLDTFHIFQYFL